MYRNLSGKLDQILPPGFNISQAIAQAKSVIYQYLSPSKPSPNATVDWQDTLNSYYATFLEYLSTRSSLENTSALLALVTFLALAMSSWSTRLGGLGRFSPFGRPQQAGSAQVSDADFSYITNDDLRKHQAESNAQSQSRDSRDLGPRRDTDVLVLKNKRSAYPVHFPAYSIDKGELMIGQVREQAAKKVGTSDVRRVKLLYRGRNLKDDNESCRHAGLREGSELMCTVGDALGTESLSSSDSEDDGFDGQQDGVSADGEQTKRRRNRGKKTKKRNRKNASGTSTPAESSLPIPPQSSQSTRLSSPRPPPTPATAMGKLDALNHALQTMLPECIAFTTSPPHDQAKKDFEHKRLSESILAQILLKLDAVETEGDPDARLRRKELVREAQKVLNGLDDAMR